MKIDPRVGSIISRDLQQKEISEQEAIGLLEIDVDSPEVHAPMSAAGAVSRQCSIAMARLLVQS